MSIFSRQSGIFVVCLLGFVAGCGNPDIIAKKVAVLTGEKKQLQEQLKKFSSENEQLKKQVEVLAGLKSDVRFENLYNLRSVTLTRYTGFYDKNKDGKKEKLIVYIQPIDGEGDIVKATGAVDVELWNLNNKGNQALLGQWNVKPDELKKLWYSAVLSINYRLMFDVADKIEGLKDPLTVKVTFTDYLTGKTFEQQKVIKP